MADNLDDLRARVEGTLRKLSFIPDDKTLATAKGLVEELRNLCEYPTMGRLAEAVSRIDPKDPKNRRLYAQYLIEDAPCETKPAVDLGRPFLVRISLESGLHGVKS